MELGDTPSYTTMNTPYSVCLVSSYIAERQWKEKGWCSLVGTTEDVPVQVLYRRKRCLNESKTIRFLVVWAYKRIRFIFIQAL